MQRFYFNLYNDLTSIDLEGCDFRDATEAMEHAARIAREMAAESVREGQLVVDHRLEVLDWRSELVGTVHFRDDRALADPENGHLLAPPQVPVNRGR